MQLVNSAKILPNRSICENLGAYPGWYFWPCPSFLPLQLGAQRASQRERREWQCRRKKLHAESRSRLIKGFGNVIPNGLDFSIFHLLTWMELPLKSLEALCKKKKKCMYMGVS